MISAALSLYHRPMEPLSVFILAGGESSRMGSDKAFLRLGGTTLLQRALTSARSVSTEVSISGSRAKFQRFAPVIEDIFSGRGPLGAIHAALSGTCTDLNVVLAVDMPFVSERFLCWIANRAMGSKAVVTVPRMNGRYQPLCAVYRKEFCALAEGALLQGRNKVDSLFADIPVQILDGDELAENGFDDNLFRNVNSPEDWAAAQAQMAGSSERL